MNTKELNLFDLELEQLDEQDIRRINGGVVVEAILSIFGVVAVVGLLAYGAGYLYGSLTCEK